VNATPRDRALHPGRLLVGIGVGILGSIALSLFAIAGLVLLIAIPIVLIAASIAGLIRPSRTPEAAGVLLGAGAILFYAAIRSASSCPGGEGACGDPNVIPLVAISLAMLAIGLLGAIASYSGRA
jgi:hypothetical protein